MPFEYRYRAKVVRVIDGDTVVLDIDRGAGLFDEDHYRLVGIDAPKASTPEGKAATAFLQNMLAQDPWVYVKTLMVRDAESQDAYGRFLADLYTDPDFHVGVNAALVAAGHAQAWDWNHRLGAAPRTRDQS